MNSVNLRRSWIRNGVPPENALEQEAPAAIGFKTFGFNFRRKLSYLMSKAGEKFIEHKTRQLWMIKL